MTGKNETRALLLSLLVTMGVVGVGAWFITAKIKPAPAPTPTPPPIEIDSVERFSQVKDVPSGTFTYGGSTTWAPIRGTLDIAIQKARPEFRLKYVQQEGGAPSSQAGIDLLSQGKVMFALASRLLTTELEEKLKDQGITLSHVQVADSFDVIAVNPSLPVPALSLDQIDAIQSGKVTNWREVEGPNLPIQEFDRDVNPDVVEPKAGTEAEPQIVKTPGEAILKVAETPGGFARLPATLAVSQCTIKVLAIINTEGKIISPYKSPWVPPAQCSTQKNQINLAAFKSGEYPDDLKNPLYVVIKQNGKIEQKVGIAYATFLRSDEGKTRLEKEGYLPVQ
jgi:phosphate transport system substrate-binding protein